MIPNSQTPFSAASGPGQTALDDAWLQRRRARIQRVKKLLRYIPRRANMHRYPVLKWFAGAARKRSYLWSFRTTEVIPAIYLGWIVAMMPLPIHMLLVLLLSFVIRSNLMIGWALVWVTNPITMVPIFLANLHLGAWILGIFGVHIDIASFREMAHEENFHWSQGARDVLEMFNAMTVGGVVTGFIGGFITAACYRLFALRFKPEPPPSAASPHS